MCGKHLGGRGPARHDLNPLVVTTYNYFDYFLFFIKNSVDNDDIYGRLLYYDS